MGGKVSTPETTTGSQLWFTYTAINTQETQYAQLSEDNAEQFVLQFNPNEIYFAADSTRLRNFAGIQRYLTDFTKQRLAQSRLSTYLKDPSVTIMIWNVYFSSQDLHSVDEGVFAAVGGVLLQALRPEKIQFDRNAEVILSFDISDPAERTVTVGKYIAKTIHECYNKELNVRFD